MQKQLGYDAEGLSLEGKKGGNSVPKEGGLGYTSVTQCLPGREGRRKRIQERTNLLIESLVEEYIKNCSRN